jgi:hypothetical protein
LKRNAAAFALPLAMGSLGLASVLASCAEAIDVGHQDETGGLVEAGGSFVDPTVEAGPDADAGPEAPELAMCASSECPWPWMTCVGADGRLPANPCTTKVSDSVFNCGGCNVQCESPPGNLWMTTSCVDGQCKYDCSPGRFDCNGLVDDGCEAEPLFDENNCGTCGHKCPDGVACIGGSCGCPPGQTDCNGECVDLQANDSNCGACGFSCQANPPADLPPAWPHMHYSCQEGQCKNLQCDQDQGQKWTDCNGHYDPDGCEVNLMTPDPNNCGECGTTCATGEHCFSRPSTGVACQCRDGTTYCPPHYTSWPFTQESCADLDNDPQNCGACGYACPVWASNGTATCSNGRCGFVCNEGRIDLNGKSADGCEVDLNWDPRNCGSVGHECDIGAGQPCVEGQCATQPCDAGVPQ